MNAALKRPDRGLIRVSAQLRIHEETRHRLGALAYAGEASESVPRPGLVPIGISSGPGQTPPFSHGRASRCGLSG